MVDPLNVLKLNRVLVLGFFKDNIRTKELNPSVSEGSISIQVTLHTIVRSLVK